MCKFTNLATAAMIAAGTGWISFGQPSFLHAQETKVETKVEQMPADNQQQQMNERMKDHMKDMHGDKGMDGMRMHTAEGSRVLARATKAALGPNALQALSEQFVAADRERIRSANVDTTQLDQTVKQLNADWKEKFGHDLTEQGMASALNPDAREGMRDGMAQRPMSPDRRGGGMPGVEATPPSGDAAGSINLDKPNGADATAKVTPPAAGVQKTPDAPRTGETATGTETDADRARTAGGMMQPDDKMMKDGHMMKDGGHMSDAKRTATYTLPARDGMKPTALQLQQEPGQWKIDLDDSIDATKLAANLNRQLKMVSDTKAQWPAEEPEALRILAQHVAAALTDTSTSSY